MLSPIIKLDSVFLREVATGQPHAVKKKKKKSGCFQHQGCVELSDCCILFFLLLLTDRKAFYVIFTWESGAQIYELVAQSVGERKM